jgi:hypothetical protein
MHVNSIYRGSVAMRLGLSFPIPARGKRADAARAIADQVAALYEPREAIMHAPVQR